LFVCLFASLHEKLLGIIWVSNPATSKDLSNPATCLDLGRVLIQIKNTRFVRDYCKNQTQEVNRGQNPVFKEASVRCEPKSFFPQGQLKGRMILKKKSSLRVPEGLY